MKVYRPADQRGRTTHGARTRLCAFSSGDFYDPDWSGFGALRQLNEEHMPSGATVPLQRVANMELLTLVLDGTLVRDGVALEAGALAWTGAGHASDTPVETAGADGARVLRIAIQPDRVNLPPAAGITRVASEAGSTLLAAPEGAEDSLPIRQQAWLCHARLAPGARVDVTLEATQRHWLQILRGGVAVDGHALASGDALGVYDEAITADLVATADGAELLLITLPG
ncbi:hypothetical protein LU699_10500 [Luteimonas fraxinea]|uniref:Quercetin 2,3-dioxygenase C-terminal cupin domain-containing protein n=1 Tax=Luteimonas fraxinea TaxID=2901869 RepID=A0ABS8UGD7_9GAMM|nr:hypothetical protein [Luteimonas fraxinea]MCD9098319.1 hypothetical protein [Luteimonas fraxinea]MCD9127051.1 hypothetical protein [Luteimonas fraxinea]UHH08747.1 hypothetical protein LU699_10500 [Luteimonas fraxinea]